MLGPGLGHTQVSRLSAEFGQQHHFRLYSVADLPERGEDGRPRIKIAVRRCSYIDAYSGEPLWHFQANQDWKASPMTYMVAGRQYVAMASGLGFWAFTLPD